MAECVPFTTSIKMVVAYARYQDNGCLTAASSSCSQSHFSRHCLVYKLQTREVLSVPLILTVLEVKRIRYSFPARVSSTRFLPSYCLFWSPLIFSYPPHLPFFFLLSSHPVFFPQSLFLPFPPLLFPLLSHSFPTPIFAPPFFAL